MRIVQVATTLGVGGVQGVVALLACGLAERGHQVKVVGLYGHDVRPDVPASVPQTALGLPVGSQTSLLRAVPPLRRLARGADVVHSHAFHATFASRLASVGAPWELVSTVHSSQEGGSLHRRLARLTFPLSDAVTVVGGAALAANEASGALPGGRARIVHNGLDLARLSPARGRDTVRAELGLEPGQDLVLAVGRLTAAKDYPTMLRAMAAVVARRPRARLFVAGDGECRGDLERLRDKLGLGKSVTFLGRRGDVPDLMGACDVYCMSSAWEGLPLVAGEAMAARSRLVVTDVPGIIEVVGDTALVAPRGDADLLADRLLAALEESPAQRRAVGDLAAARVRADFGVDAMVDAYEALYRELTGSVERH